MCGIAGFAGFDDSNLLREIGRRLAHRGPDAEGFYEAPLVGLAHRRLSIIDLANGRQPMSNETGSLQLVFNGEIYNYQPLTAELKSKGHQFKTASDTETILHLYEEYGADCVKHLRGMFAFALWDSEKHSLLLARDRIGEKPLYYAVQGQRLIFGSEIKAILPALDHRTVNPRAVCEFLAAGYVPAPRSFFREIQKLPAGCILQFAGGTATVTRYWDREAMPQSQLSFGQACQDLQDMLRESIALCLKSDVEVGAFLSGGLDSSLVVALMRELNTTVQTFSVGYEGIAVGFNELDYARRVADDLGTRHHELILEAHSSMELLPRILWHYDEPHGEPTSVLVYLLCQFTRQNVTVALGGTGGDEFFFGYPRHKAIRWLNYFNLIPRVVRRGLIERVVAKWPESTRGSRFAKRAKRFVQGALSSPAETYLNWVSLLSREVRSDLLSSNIKEESEDPSGEQFMREYLCSSVDDFYSRVTNLDVGGYLSEFQLAYMDRMSMAHGLEVRSPLCDFRLAEFATKLPANYRVKSTRSKHILKEAARQWLPREIIDRKKVGFDSPIGEWFKGDLREFLNTFLSVENVEMSGLLNPLVVRQLVEQHLTGLKDYSMQLWSIIALEAWYRMYIESESEPADANDVSLKDLRGAEMAEESMREPVLARQV